MIRVLIVGAGDVARRLCPLLAGRFQVYVLLRDWGKAPQWRRAGARPIPGDLDDFRSLRRAASLAQWVVHLAPPAADGEDDLRSKRLIAALSAAPSLAQRLIYISTSGVYGDCAGAVIDETRTPVPLTPRARRRVAAEHRLRRFGGRGCRVSVLRVPGIYAAERTPLARLQAGTPVLRAEDDVYTNHIHADDLAAAARAALIRGKANRVYHASDGAQLKMADYFDLFADLAGLARPARVTREEAERVLSPQMMSFMAESRRLKNHRLTHELKLRLRYPTPKEGLAAGLERK